MSVIQGNALSDDEVDTGDIGHSLRFRSSAGAYLSRTPTASNRKTWTWSGWVKRGALGVSKPLLWAGTSGAAETQLFFHPNDKIYFHNYPGSYTIQVSTAGVFRDPTAHIHIELAVDTTQATLANGVRLWINGVLQTLSGTYTQNTDTYVSAANVHWICTDYTSNYFDGYLSRVCFIDGTALTPSSFGYLNTEINEWVSKSQSAVKAVVDAGGTNSFMLDFDDATSLTTLGYDKSSKGNNWTLNNFSLTAGTTYDHMLDVPGNSFATLNPLDTSSTIALSAANLTALKPSESAWRTSMSSMFPTSGKWYAEFSVDAFAGTENYIIFGVAKPGYDTSTYIGAASLSSGYQWVVGGGDNCSLFGEGAVAGSCLGAGDLAAGNVVSVCYDANTGRLWAARNNAWMNSGNPAAGTGYTHNGITPTGRAFGVSIYTTGYTVSANFGQRPFTYTPPTGFLALCQANLPDVAIKNPKLHFDIKTRTGTAATYSVTGLGFQPDLVWSKSRGRAVDHALYDSVRGVQKQLESNSTGAETTETTGLTAFNSDGYTGGALDQINGTTATNSFVDWLWKAGGAAVSNTAGSITSQVSANVDAGFSVVTYTGTGANATVGHGLGKAPGLVIYKNREVAGNWITYHFNVGATGGVYLNLTNSAFTSSTAFNNTHPTTSVVSIGTSSDLNTNGNDYVAYCFADIEGYSKAFSYTGNGSADGPYVHLGFKPRWLLIKRTDAVASWRLLDTTRSTYNVMGEELYPNLTNAGAVFTALDTTADGIKLRTSDPTYNSNTATYIGFAIADVAGKYSLGR